MRITSGIFSASDPAIAPGPFGLRTDRADHKSSEAPKAVVICLSGQVIQGISQEVIVAALPNRFRQNFSYCALKPRMVI
jgi:hypothetical protein